MRYRKCCVFVGVDVLMCGAHRKVLACNPSLVLHNQFTITMADVDDDFMAPAENLPSEPSSGGGMGAGRGKGRGKGREAKISPGKKTTDSNCIVPSYESSGRRRRCSVPPRLLLDGHRASR